MMRGARMSRPIRAVGSHTWARQGCWPARIGTAAHLLKSQGVLTLIWRADGLDDVLGALQPGFGSVTVLPVHPRPGTPPIRVLVRAVKGGRGAQATCPALVLNDERGQPTAAAEAVLRAGEALNITET